MLPRFRTKHWYETFWQKQPDAYGDPSADLKQLIEKVGKEIQGERKSLDIACGNGRYFSILLENGFSVDAIDIACAAIDLGKKKEPTVTTICGDFLEMDTFPSKEYSLIFSSGYFDELTNDQQKIVSEKIQSLTAENGYVLLKYCLEIKNRGLQVDKNLIVNNFPSDTWMILYQQTDVEFRPYPQGIPGEDALRTETVCLQKK